jgi:hypothetical protein
VVRHIFQARPVWIYSQSNIMYKHHKLSLSYLKEHLKLYINFLYNYSVSCLAFEINRLILIKSSVYSAILDMHSICTRHK